MQCYLKPSPLLFEDTHLATQPIVGVTEAHGAELSTNAKLRACPQNRVVSAASTLSLSRPDPSELSRLRAPGDLPASRSLGATAERMAYFGHTCFLPMGPH